jgi:hypothetical protein
VATDAFASISSVESMIISSGSNQYQFQLPEGAATEMTPAQEMKEREAMYLASLSVTPLDFDPQNITELSTRILGLENQEKLSPEQSKRIQDILEKSPSHTDLNELLNDLSALSHIGGMDNALTLVESGYLKRSQIVSEARDLPRSTAQTEKRFNALVEHFGKDDHGMYYAVNSALVLNDIEGSYQDFTTQLVLLSSPEENPDTLLTLLFSASPEQRAELMTKTPSEVFQKLEASKLAGYDLEKAFEELTNNEIHPLQQQVETLYGLEGKDSFSLLLQSIRSLHLPPYQREELLFTLANLHPKEGTSTEDLFGLHKQIITLLRDTQYPGSTIHKINLLGRFGNLQIAMKLVEHGALERPDLLDKTKNLPEQPTRETVERFENEVAKARTFSSGGNPYLEAIQEILENP